MVATAANINARAHPYGKKGMRQKILQSGEQAVVDKVRPQRGAVAGAQHIALAAHCAKTRASLQDCYVTFPLPLVLLKFEATKVQQKPPPKPFPHYYDEPPVNNSKEEEAQEEDQRRQRKHKCKWKATASVIMMQVGDDNINKQFDMAD